MSRFRLLCEVSFEVEASNDLAAAKKIEDTLKKGIIFSEGLRVISFSQKAALSKKPGRIGGP